jgi:hypothetical protein
MANEKVGVAGRRIGWAEIRKMLSGEFRVQCDVDNGLGRSTAAKHHHTVRRTQPDKQIRKAILFCEVAAPPVVSTEPLQVNPPV